MLQLRRVNGTKGDFKENGFEMYLFPLKCIYLYLFLKVILNVQDCETIYALEIRRVISTNANFVENVFEIYFFPNFIPFHISLIN